MPVDTVVGPQSTAASAAWLVGPEGSGAIIDGPTVPPSAPKRIGTQPRLIEHLVKTAVPLVAERRLRHIRGPGQKPTGAS